MYALDRMPIMTPEGVALEVPLAGVGSRSLATGVDMIAQAILIILFREIVTAGSPVASAVNVIWSFLVLFFYPVLFETLWSGRTPGKRLGGLRVVTLSGGPITARASVTRNLVRIIDFLPAFYPVGLIATLASQHNQRLGDMAAGTVVMVEPAKANRGRLARRQDAKALAQPAPWLGMPSSGNDVAFPLPPGLTAQQRASWDLSRISKSDVGSVRAFLDRRSSLSPEIRQRLALQFAAAVASRVVGAPLLHPEVFLEQVVAEKERRR
jgi:uncharacterized RDD family membrane protein YckC